MNWPIPNNNRNPLDTNVTHYGNLDVENLNVSQNLYGVGQLPRIRGTWYYVDPTSGNANNDGLTASTAVASIATAYSKCTSGAGDGICLLSAGTTAAGTTSYLSAVIDWTKHGITVVGVAAPTRCFGRARIANASAVLTLAYLIDVQGDNNTFANVHFYNGGTNAAAVGGIKVTGNRNAFINCHIVGAAGATAAATHRSLELNTGKDNTFVGCTFGSDTIDRGNNASCEVLITGEAARNRFYGCEFQAYVSTGTAHGAINLTSTSGGRPTILEGCTFYCFATAQAAAVLTSGENDKIFIKRSSTFGYSAWGGSEIVYVDMPTTAASAAGGLATTA